MSSRTISTILNLKDNFSNVINRATSSTKQFQRQITQAENQAKRMRQSVENSFGGVAAKASAVLGGIGLVAFAKDSLKLASDLNEVQNVVSVTFGDMTSKIEDFSKEANKSFGLSELQAKKYSSTLGSMFKSAGYSGDQLNQMSTDLAGLSGDLASFYNLKPDEAFDKIKSAISGQSEPMLALGKDISDTATSTYALANGFKKQWSSATQGEKELWRYKLIMEQTKDAQGDYAKTAGGFANQLRNLGMNFATLGAKIMAYTVPSFEKLFSKINNFVSNVNVKPTMDRISASLSSLGQFVTELGKNMTWILPIVAGVLSGFMAFMQITKVITIIKSITKAITGVGMLLNPVTLVAAGMGLLVAGMITAYKNSSTFREKIDGLLTKFQGFGDFLGKTLPPLIEKANLFFIDKLCPALKVLGDYVEGVALPAIENFTQSFVDLATTIWGSIQPAVDWIVKNIVPDAWLAIGAAIQTILTVATDVLNFIKDNWGLIKPIIEGITVAVLEWKAGLIILEFWTKAVSAVTAGWGVITTTIQAIREGTTLWTVAQTLLNIALKDNPIGLTIIALTALGVAIYEVVTHWQDICTWISTTWDKLKNNPVAEFIANMNPFTGVLFEIAKHWTSISDGISKAWDWLTKWNGTDAQSKNTTVTETKMIDTKADLLHPKPFDFSGVKEQNATGTQYWKGGLTTVGEHGPELVNLPSGSKVSTASQTKNMLGGNSGINIYLTVQGNIIGNEEYADSIGEHIVNKINLSLANM